MTINATSNSQHASPRGPRRARGSNSLNNPIFRIRRKGRPRWQRLHGFIGLGIIGHSGGSENSRGSDYDKNGSGGRIKAGRYQGQKTLRIIERNCWIRNTICCCALGRYRTENMCRFYNGGKKKTYTSIYWVNQILDTRSGRESFEAKHGGSDCLYICSKFRWHVNN